MISYHVPTEPSALRVSAWRALKQLGAVKLGDGLYFLPNRPACSSALADLRERLREGGGTAVTMLAQGLAPGDVELLEQTFRQARADEFRQVEKSARKLVAHIGREEAEDDYRFAELDALEEELEKVRRQFDRAASRDYFGSPEREKAAHAVGEAVATMGRYVEQAYRQDSGAVSEQIRVVRAEQGAKQWA